MNRNMRKMYTEEEVRKISGVNVIENVNGGIETEVQTIEVQGLSLCESTTTYKELIGCAVTVITDSGFSYPSNVSDDGTLQFLDIGKNLTNSSKIDKIIYIKP